jgi:hypothetical protein
MTPVVIGGSLGSGDMPACHGRETVLILVHARE